MIQLPGLKVSQQNIALRDDHCYSLHLLVVLMFWPVSVNSWARKQKDVQCINWIHVILHCASGELFLTCNYGERYINIFILWSTSIYVVGKWKRHPTCVIVYKMLKSTIKQNKNIFPALPPLSHWLSVAAAELFIPESVQAQVWILQLSRQQLHSWVFWMIIGQVQLSKMGGIGVQSWGQRSTAFLCDQTAWQPVNTQNKTHGRISGGIA